jgi:hypothetical protein
MSRVDEYRRWAAECFLLASRAERKETRNAWMQLAEKWKGLAKKASGSAPQQAQQPQEPAVRSPDRHESGGDSSAY